MLTKGPDCPQSSERRVTSASKRSQDGQDALESENFIRSRSATNQSQVCDQIRPLPEEGCTRLASCGLAAVDE